jgi:FkbM family methyltransferase
MFWLFLARLYGHIHVLLGRYLHIYPSGLGYACRKIRLEHVIEVKGCRYFFYRPAASMYSHLIVSKFPEPETHLFFDKIFASLPTLPITFIDIGAAVGEMIMDVARHDNVVKVFGFEPDPDLAEACRLSACVNRFSKVEMRSKPLSDVAAPIKFDSRRGHGSSGSIMTAADTDVVVMAGTLDNEFTESLSATILLIDVEGAEIRVLKGGSRFIRENKPMVIFEYNFVSQEFFKLDDVRAELGPSYLFYRLRSDGRLDQDFSKTWNCVAIHQDSPFAAASKAWMA